MLYHFFTKSIGLLARIYFRSWTCNSNVIPKKGAAIVASNHLAVIDSVVLPCMVLRKIWFIGKKEYFQTDTLKHRIQKWFFTSVSVYPVDRAGGKAAQEALEVGRNAIKAGNLFGIYPEGTRSPDGNLYKGRTGIAKLALETKVPVIPVAMHGTRRSQKPGSPFPKPEKCGVLFGNPVDLSDLFSNFESAQKNNDADLMHKTLRAATDRVMFALHAVSGQRYIDIYATDAKQLIKEGKNVALWAKENSVKIIDPVDPKIAQPKAKHATFQIEDK